MKRASGSHILVNLYTRRLAYFEGDRQVNLYPVGVGKAATPTPTGSYVVVVKIVQPGGMLGTRWMGLSIPGGNYGIHGTNNPSSIGGYVSNGCIRMYNHDVEALFPKVSIGTPVEIIKGTAGSKQVNLQGNPGAGSKIHVVQAGENLWAIAARYDTDLSLLLETNKISNPEIIYPGRQIIIPTEM
ncbi:L,D-transpeptidase family protein [Pelotomaculum propionicicum]|uniref:Putative L,D-transpeptidase YkuD n=1 Tax=Pelotomaculum propionicicum TaxID=258475 RepID=A0A4Y7RU75_9FIRM|nr:L,D-transpeptidase family protein [Pelotomaculum propionicicum]NLI11828.1 L,D-transpeptidase family protein [Peptococcaceae bacterium]TEB12242.1 putative L,D-transpeptidase YkuD [Pelotomaculum propionicicum]